MASGLSETAKLVSSLELKDNFTPTANKAMKSLGKMESTSYRVGQNIGKGFHNAAHNLKNLGLVAGGIAVAGLAKSIQLASDLNEQMTKSQAVFGKSSQEVIKFADTAAASLGLAKAEALAGAGALGNMFKTTGLADKTSAKFSITLVKLASDMASFNNEEPTDMLDRLRAGLSGEAEPLRRFGVLLSEARVKEEAYATGIAKRGKALTEAQKVQARYSLILKDTKVQQGDFAKTSEGLANQMRILKANLSDTGATIGTALLPQMAKLAIRFNDIIKAHLPDIKAFAGTLPGIFDQLISFGESIPWQSIKDAFVIMGTGSRALLDAFLGLPSWVKTAVITGWGLNKLTGGALGGIVSELGKGLIKGVLGINAGVVHLKAGAVTGAGGGGAVGTAGKAGKGASLLGAAAKVFVVGAAVGAFAELLSIRGDQSAANRRGIQDLTTKTSEYTKVAGISEMQGSLKGILAYDRKLSTSTDILNAEVVAFQLNIDGVKDAVRAQEATLLAGINALTDPQITAVENMKGKIAGELAGNKTAIDGAASASTTAGNTAANAARTAGYGIQSAIRSSQPVITTNTDVRVYVTAAGVTKSVTEQSRYGKGNGSAGGGGDSGVSSSDL